MTTSMAVSIMTTTRLPVPGAQEAPPLDLDAALADTNAGGQRPCPVCGLDPVVWPRRRYCCTRCRRRAAYLRRRAREHAAQQPAQHPTHVLAGRTGGITSTPTHAAAPARPALRYYGGKWRLAPWIIAHFPPHTCYVEPFGGAASVLLRKPPARYEVYNDLDGEIVTFFRVLRERPDDLIRAIACTPFARAEVTLACAPAPPDLDDLERARRLYVRSWQGRHGLPVQGPMGWRFERAATRHTTVVDDWRDPAHLWAVAERLRRVQLECDDALRVIRRFDGRDTLVYIDPPYPAATRSARWATAAYRHELADDDHRRLAEVLHGVAGMVVVSGYPCPLYRKLYGDWCRVLRRVPTHGEKVATEALWLSPHAVERLGHRQLPLLLPLAEDA